MWRVLTHERGRATLAEIETHWSLEDLVRANLALDVIDELEFQSAERRRAQSE